jgi:hypothetical protein
LLGTSYEAGTTAHLDVSYRPTKAMLKNKHTDPKEFRRMVKRDVAWFFRLLPLCPNLRLLLIFGPIIRANGSTEPLVRFLRRRAQHHDFTVLPDGRLQDIKTRKALLVHEADTPNEKCITCRVVKNLHLHRQDLRQRIGFPV